MIIAPGFPCPSSVLLLAIAGDGDDDERLAQFAAERGGDLIAVEAGQAEIEQHDVGFLASSDVEGLEPVVGNLDVVAEAFEPECRGLGGIEVVVDHEDIGHIDLATVSEHRWPREFAAVGDVALAADRLGWSARSTAAWPLCPGRCCCDGGVAGSGLPASCGKDPQTGHLPANRYPGERL